MEIRLATMDDVDVIMDIYDVARRTMRENGNHSQWVNGYPSRSDVAQDIGNAASFVVCERCEDDGAEGDEAIRGVFMFALGDDPTYAVIEDGAWLNDEPYGVIHRIASDGKARGIMKAAMEFALERTDNIRIDTHADNSIMQGALGKLGFARCGIIHIADGSPRVAFHLVKQR